MGNPGCVSGSSDEHRPVKSEPTRESGPARGYAILDQQGSSHIQQLASPVVPEDDAVFHHERHIVQGAEVVEGVGGHGDEIGGKAGADGAAFV